eukprot:989503-Rhodomonas_salina.1
MTDGNCDEVRTSPMGSSSDVPWAKSSAGPIAVRWAHTSAGPSRRRIWKRARGGRALDIMSCLRALWTPCGSDMSGSNGGEANSTTTSLWSPLARCQCGNCDDVVTSPSGCWADASLGRGEHWPYGKGGWEGFFLGLFRVQLTGPGRHSCWDGVQRAA